MRKNYLGGGLEAREPEQTGRFCLADKMGLIFSHLVVMVAGVFPIGTHDVHDLNVANLDPGRFIQGTEVPWAVLLIKDDGVSDLDHGKVDETNVRDCECGWGGGPCLDPNPVVSVGKGAPLHGYPFHVFLLHIPSQTTNDNAMPWSAFHVIDEHVGKVIPHGDAVVAGLDYGVDDPYAVASGYVDAVGVRAVRKNEDCEVLKRDIVTGDAVDVEVLDVLGNHVLDNGVIDEVQAQVDGELGAVLVFIAVPGLLACPSSTPQTEMVRKLTWLMVTHS
ncbi:hypothetical protein SASPL_101677 [Salvia splendens]|uniref:Uncharacterized protein n=1 Tax=Salvia splendens TaxID=180675 RepID=A0A8X8YVA3_SALSN|nr:hypothetical protein SASPL_101677 [Salvia splendens]